MSHRAIASVLGAAALLAASVVGASSASALVTGATAPDQPFGNVAVHTTVQKVIRVTATGEAVTFAAAPTIEPVVGAEGEEADYTIVDSTCTDSLTSGATCTITVSFTPFALGAREASLAIVTSTPAATVPVALTGTGVLDATGTYYALSTPTRYLDTRTGAGARLAAGSTRTLQIAGLHGIPAIGVSAAVINVTAVNTTSQGFFTVYPSDKARPTASTINFPKGWIGANMATVPLGADGKIKLYNYGGAAHAIVDVLGWYAKDDTVRAAKGMGAQFHSTGGGDPERLYDSRDDLPNSNLPFQSGEYIEFTDEWDSEASANAVKAYAVNITAVDATASGVLTSWAGGAAPKPTASTVNYIKGTIAPNMAVVPAGQYGTVFTGFRILNTGSGSVHIVVDITGYYIADDSVGLRFKPLTAGASPRRILDTRTGVGLSGSFGPRQARTASAGSVASSDSIYMVGNSTGDKPTARTYLTVWSGENARPNTSNLNVNAGATRAVSTYAPLALDNTYRIYNNAGSMRVIFDAAGTLDLYPPAPPTGAPATAGTVTSDHLRPAPTANGHESTTVRRN